MKRFHVHVSVPDLAQSIQFYEQLFGAAPVVRKPDYAKWMLEDPHVNFAISERERAPGVDHVGIQVETAQELHGLAAQLKAAGAQTFDQTATTCCYAKSDKSWVTDPAGVRWETFFTFGEATAYGEDVDIEAQPATCCGSEPVQKASCCA